MQGLILAQHEHQCSPRLLQRHRNGTVGESLDTADPPRPPPFPECAPALRLPASPSPRLASTTRAFYPPNRYSRTPRTAAPASPLRFLTSWLFLTYPVASELQRGWLCSREMLIVES